MNKVLDEARAIKLYSFYNNDIIIRIFAIISDEEIFKKLSKMLKPKGTIEIIFGYDPNLEKSETERLNLKELTENERGFLKENFTKIPSLTLTSFTIVKNKELKNLQTSWGKKLAFGAERNFFKIVLTKS